MSNNIPERDIQSAIIDLLHLRGGVVTQKNGRQFIGIELNPEYVKLAEKRLLDTPQSLFNQSILRKELE